MDKLEPEAKQWLSKVLGESFKASKHVHSHQDEVYRIQTRNGGYYLKISANLKSEYYNLEKLSTIINVPKVINFYESGKNDYLIITELPGKNLVELIHDWSDRDIAEKFAEAVKRLHCLDTSMIFPKAGSNDVVLHGDMALPNIIISEQGEIGFIDFGQMTFGAPELDLADAIWSLQRNIGPSYGEFFLQKYGPTALTPKIEEALKYRHPHSEV